MSIPTTHDVVIVGGGPAGLSAALFLARTRRRVLLLDSGAYRNANAAAMHSVSTHDGRPPADYRRLAHAELGHYPTVEVRMAEARSAVKTPDRFQVELTDGETVAGRRLLLATGVVDDLPAIPGLEEIWGRSALHCPYCHGYEVRDQPLAVLGSGHAAPVALILRRLSPDVVVLANGEDTISPEMRDALSRNGVSIREEPVTGFVSHDGQLERIVFSEGPDLPRHAVFAASQMRQRSPLAAELGCAILPDGSVEVDDFQATSVPGVWAAGDMARRPSLPGPITVIPAASASGAMAGGTIDRDLLTEECGLVSFTAAAKA